MKYFAQKICMELTENTIRIWSQDRGIVLHQPHRELLQPLFVELHKKKPFSKEKHISSFSDLYEEGRVKDAQKLEWYLRTIFEHVGIHLFPLGGHQISLSVSSLLCSADKQALYEVCSALGFSTVIFCAQTLASAVGNGFTLPLSQSAFLVHLGTGYSEVGLISYSSVIKSSRLLFSGSLMLQLFRSGARSLYGLHCTEEQFESLLSIIHFCLLENDHSQKDFFKAMQSIDSLRSFSTLPFQFFSEHFKTLFDYSLEELRFFLSELSTTQLATIVDQGIVLTGELAQIQSLPEYCSKHLSVPVYALPNASETTFHGLIALQKTSAMQ